ncbi:serine protease 57 [Trichechus inunguis]|uniref:Serine protease 57 n=1 Tax=Trichechus manatus latirostris TaxID=127582 RepID=A0A2Y9DPV8_TRIMA|nr:serine protease 57 [Trichechus manatus latirostris]
MRPGMGGWGCLLLTVAEATLVLLTRPPGSWGVHIIGGHEVVPHSRPYMASVHFRGQHHCGGFLLHAQWVVSAAHCFRNRDPLEGLVVLGAHDLQAPEPTQQVFSIKQAFIHPNYQPSSHANDICLLKLNSSAVLGGEVGLLKLPQKGSRQPKAGALCRVAGWGFRSDFEDPPPALMEAEVRVLGLDACNSSWCGQLSPAMLCTRSGDNQRRGFCTADSGGPLVCGSRAHGLVSFSGFWCGDPKYPDVYTRVSAFVTWIRGVVRKDLRGTTTAPCPGPPGPFQVLAAHCPGGTLRPREGAVGTPRPYTCVSPHASRTPTTPGPELGPP